MKCHIAICYGKGHPITKLRVFADDPKGLDADVKYIILTDCGWIPERIDYIACPVQA